MRTASLAIACIAFGCAPAALTPLAANLDVTSPAAQFHIAYSAKDRDTASELASILEERSSRVTVWGSFVAPVTIFLIPSHEELEIAVDKEGYSWLQAWARYRTIHLQSPRTWGVFRAPRAKVSELVTHELTHCLMYQLSASEQDWMDTAIPIWFREGMASVTAEQAERRHKARDIRDFLRDNPGIDPVADAQALYRGDPAWYCGPLSWMLPRKWCRGEIDMVYSAAHRAFEFLVQRYGNDGVAAIMAQMHKGARFQQAFAAAIGISQEDFEGEFRRYVEWEGWQSAER